MAHCYTSPGPIFLTGNMDNHILGSRGKKGEKRSKRRLASPALSHYSAKGGSLEWNVEKHGVRWGQEALPLPVSGYPGSQEFGISSVNTSIRRACNHACWARKRQGKHKEKEAGKERSGSWRENGGQTHGWVESWMVDQMNRCYASLRLFLN